MADSQIEEIRDKLNVIDVVGSYVKLTKTGINYRGVCPFHSEKKPSFFVNPGRQLWHCFGCGAGSSIFDFVMKIEGVEFGDALRILAAKAGVQLKRENVQLRTERQRLYEICELATMFFEKQLESSAVGKEAEQYLNKRGITNESIKKWRLGYSPDTWNGLTDFLIGKGYLRQEVVRAGLAIEKENNKNDSYDRFRGRIIFPVFDLNGQPVGFGGRVFKQDSEKEVAKYINTPQTLLYDKSGIIYGLNHAKLAIRKANQCVVTEGYTDVIMCHQAAFENTVAASGTALTLKHLTILKRYTENLVLAFDMDVAGDSATKRGITNAQELGFNIKIIESYGNAGVKSDPADIILKDPKVWESSVEKAKSIMDYYFDSAFSHFDKTTPTGKKEIGRIVLPAIKQLPNKIEQSFWVQKLLGMLDIREEAILEELAKMRVVGPERTLEHIPSVSQEHKGGEAARKKLIEEKMVSLIFKDPAYAKLIAEEQFALFSKEAQEIVQLAQREQPLPDERLSALALRADVDYEEDGEEEIQLCLLQLKQIELKNRLEHLSREIKKAEFKKDSQKLENLIGEFNKLTKEL